jgi:hypothetical protein
MQICRPNCVSGMTQADWANNCTNDARKGGISRLLFYKCNDTFEFKEPGGWSNLNNIKQAMCEGFLFVSGPVLGQKPKGSFTKKRMSSCAPEVTTGGSKSITFQDYNADVDFKDNDFWNGVLQNKPYLYLGYITCDDRLYQVEGAWDLEIDEVHEETNEGNSFYDGALTFQGIELLKPVEVPGLNSMLEAYDHSACPASYGGYYTQPW